MAAHPRERETHVLKDLDSLKKIAKLLSHFSRHNNIFPSIDKEYREHAGEVRRRDDRTERAEAPPSHNSQAGTAGLAKPNPGRTKQTNGFEEDDGSDSERDNPQGSGLEGGGGVTKQNESLIVAVKPMRSPISASLTPEEEQRKQLHRIGREREANGIGYRISLDDFSANRRYTEEDKVCLLRLLADTPDGRKLLHRGAAGTESGERPPKTVVFNLQQLRMSQYLDEALDHGMAGIDVIDDKNCLSEGISKFMLLEDIIKQAERYFVTWWEQFVTPDEHSLLGVVKSLRKPGVLGIKLMTQFRSHNAKDLRLDPFTAAYENLIFNNLHPVGGGSRQKRIEARWRRATTHEYPRMRGFKAELELGYADITQILAKSQGNEGLSDEYVDWICECIPSDLIETCCQQRLKQIRGKRIRQILESTSISQKLNEDNEDMDGYGTLSLLLLKGDMLVSMKQVSPLDQERLGWYRTPGDRGAWPKLHRSRKWRSTDQLPSSKFYRHEFDEILGRTFKVGVYQELLGLWTPEGDAYLVDNVIEGKSEDEDEDTGEGTYILEASYVGTSGLNRIFYGS
ncbi:hypothetical protein GQX73_g4998 [Xylaria multiplex]|uniref:Uncharacterized protein n=1 Tax=Xylaria multiplex TaxID=323545 RepID=A0A7C8N7M8_9PEZI|nr:hypothetical protein GQX73_g4998 [Xylaria multiplex]